MYILKTKAYHLH